MSIRQKLTLATLAVGIGAVNAAGAATVNLGTYTFDTDALASSASSSSTLYDGNNYVSPSASPALTDSAGQTFLSTAPYAGHDDVSVNVGFANSSVVNGPGADLALFFLFDQSGNTNQVSINGITQALTYADVLSSGGTLQVANGVPWAGSTLDNVMLTVALVDLDAFGVAPGAVSNSLDVILNQTSSDPAQISALSLVGAVNTSVVPVPAAVWMFGSGLLALGGVARRRA